MVQLTSMKTLSSFLLFLLIPLGAYGEPESAISRLNPNLVPVYESLTKEGQPTGLVGKRLDLTLTLRHASDRYLLFNDTQIVVDKETRYYLIKWKFKPGDVESLLGKSNVKCKVSGRIVEVIKGPKTPRMPYIVVELISVELQLSSMTEMPADSASRAIPRRPAPEDIVAFSADEVPYGTHFKNFLPQWS